MIDKEDLFKTVKTALEQGKTVSFIRTWTGQYVMGDRRFSNINHTIKVDDETVFSKDYETDRDCDIDYDNVFRELRKRIYIMLRNQALKLLAQQLGYQSVQELDEKAEILGDDEGNVLVGTEDGKVYSAVFRRESFFHSPGKHIETYVFHKPKIILPKDA